MTKNTSTIYLQAAVILPLLFGGVSLASAQEQAPAVQQEAAAPINLNIANAEQLAQALRGIGLARARAIIDLREKLGGFSDIEDLLQVKGIGVRVLEQNRDRMVVQ